MAKKRGNESRTESVADIPTMSGPATLDTLEAIGKEWTAQGVVVECGCWLGAGSCALLRGMEYVERTDSQWANTFYGCDRWRASASEVKKAAAQGVTLEEGEDLFPHWFQNILTVEILPWISFMPGELKELQWSGPEVEILVIDAAKREPAFSHLMGQFTPWLVKGAWVALLDYYYWRKFSGPRAEAYKAQQRYVAAHEDLFYHIVDISGESGAVFRFYKEGRRGIEA